MHPETETSRYFGRHACMRRDVCKQFYCCYVVYATTSPKMRIELCIDQGIDMCAELGSGMSVHMSTCIGLSVCMGTHAHCDVRRRVD